MSLSTVIKSIQNIMRKDVGVDGDAQRIGQLGWMLFLKIFDDREQEREILEARLSLPHPRRPCSGATGPRTRRASPATRSSPSSTTSSSRR